MTLASAKVKMSRALFAAILIIALSFLSARASRNQSAISSTDEPVTSRVDKLFAQLDKPDSAGCAVGVVKDGKLVYARGYGMADLEHQVPISTRSAFDIASISKQFTAMAIMLLVQQGKVSLDDDVHKFVPEVPDYQVTITVRHLLNHTSGLRNLFLISQLRGWRWGDLETRADVLDELTRQKELNFKPGEEHSYTNTGYFLLGEIVKRVSGMPLSQFAEQNIFKPLGMLDTQIHDDVALIMKNRAWGYGFEKDRGWINNITRFEGTGDSNVYTTIEDLTRWDQNFYDGKVGGNQVIALMLEPGKLESGRVLSYAAGLRVGQYKGLNLIWHAGSSSSRSEYLRFPDQHFSVFCLSNSGAIDPSPLARQVADIYLAGLLKPESSGGPPPPEKQTKGTAEVEAFIREHSVNVSQEKLARLAGYYINTDNGNLRRVFIQDGKLMTPRQPGINNELAPLAENKFVIAGIPIKLLVSFNEPWPGTRLMSVLSDGPNPLTLVYVGLDKSMPAQLSDYTGYFRSDEVDAAVKLLVKDAKLVLCAGRCEEPSDDRSGPALYTLEPVSVDAFKNEWMGLVRFTRDSKSRVDGFAITNFAGGVRHLRFEKGHLQFMKD